MIGLILFVIMVVALALLWLGAQRSIKPAVLPEAYRDILEQYVPFYANLKPEGKERFETRMKQFLSRCVLPVCIPKWRTRTRYLLPPVR